VNANVSLLKRPLPEVGGRDYNVITMATISRIVRIGNSRGIRVPKALLEQAQLPEEVELLAEPGRLVVRAVRRTRAGWADAAARMHERGDDQLLNVVAGNRFDTEEWEWR
jgi:antitoxin MazE